MTQTIETSPPPAPRSDDRDSAKCPDWCTAGSKQYPCRGEHTAISSGSYVPATGGHFDRSETIDGGKVPVVGVGLYWAEAWGEGQEVTLSIGEDQGYVSFKPGEALTLATEIVVMLQAMVHASDISIAGAEKVLELVAMAKALESGLTRGAVTA